MEQVSVDRLVAGPALRCGGPCPEHVRELAAAGVALPPIVVQRDTYQVVDGMHRLLAARARGAATIAVRFVDAGGDEAFVLAVQLNAAHGLPLSLSDRKAAANRIVASHPAWSDRRIAAVTGLSADTVGEIRRNGPQAGPAARIGRDGRLRPVDRMAKRRVAAELISNQPELSLRQVARAVGISPETVRSVRAELRSVGDCDGGRSRAVAARAVPPPSPHPEDWAVTVQRLRSDPTLCFTDNGRVLLRLLDMHSLTPAHWAAILRSVPAHNRPTVARLAERSARVWQSIAEHLSQGQPEARPRRRKAAA
ncbi:ParB N-terminal domain-containing protein [Dactylosporangium sp. CA-052675]|uniref:ParB N-terminal domain-containing protein n=1 Tax=Dactylosporangium sp. CA-052675 TaxID=3239927 RepID=UPI003D8C7177